jgi:hypothetical protein
MDRMTALGVLLMDAGLAAVAIGLGSLIKPPRRLGIATRRRAALVAGGGVAMVLAAAALPAPTLRSARSTRSARSLPEEAGSPGRPAPRIDDFAPEYQFQERHEIRIHAAPARVLWATRTVTAGEITFFRTLTWLRRPRRPWVSPPASILAPPSRRPILEVATASSFLQLAEEADREIVVGTLVIRSRALRPGTPGEFQAVAEPGNVKAVMNFLVEPEAGGWSRLSTETRVFATDPASRRRFAVYWRLILPGSSLIRVEWLRAIRRRAEG